MCLFYQRASPLSPAIDLIRSKIDLCPLMILSATIAKKDLKYF